MAVSIARARARINQAGARTPEGNHITPGATCITIGRAHITPGATCITTGRAHIAPGATYITTGKAHITAGAHGFDVLVVQLFESCCEIWLGRKSHHTWFGREVEVAATYARFMTELALYLEPAAGLP